MLTLLFKYIFRFLLSIAIILGILAFAPGIPPYVEFLAYDVKPVSNYDGKTVNVLNEAKVCIEDGKIRRPESVAVKGSSIYVGESGLGSGEDLGKIVKINEETWSISTVADLSFPCEKLGRSECSGVLGIRFDPTTGKLLAADMHGGIIRIDVQTGKVETLISPKEVIEGKKPGFFEDVTVGKDGTIYWTDGSTSFSHKNHNSMLTSPSGRLLKYDPTSKKSTVLIDNIHFANGVELSEDETFVLVSESMKFRVLRYYVKGAKKGKTDIFLDGLPGIPDNIRLNGKGGFYIAIPMSRPVVEINKYPTVMKIVERISYLYKATIAQIYNLYPYENIRYMYDMVDFMIMASSPKQAIIIEADKNGQIIRVLNSTTGNLGFLSQASSSNKYLYFVSPIQDKVWCLEKNKL